jgi:AbrB family looped-hinge helix DNA binding protein
MEWSIGAHCALTQARIFIKYDYMKIQSKARRAAVIVKIGVSRQVAIPKKLHDELGLVPGDYLQVEVEGDCLILTPKALIEKRLAESLDDIREGRVHGPFRSARALVRSLHSTKKTKSS